MSPQDTNAATTSGNRTGKSEFGRFLQDLFFSHAVAKSQQKTSRKHIAAFNRSRDAFNQRSKHASHRLNCLQGYRAKADLVRQGKGKNSLAGVPSTYVNQ